MARQSSITTLPEEVRRWLERALTEQNFSGYEALEAMMREKGFAISKSAIHRYGQKIERRFAAIKASTEAARIITEGAADDQDARSEAVIALCQTEIFEAMISLQEANDEEMTPLDRMNAMSKVAKNIATLTRASIANKQFKIEAENRIRQQLLDEQKAKLDAMGVKSGVTEGIKLAIRAALGIG
jgi:hypothetical protein